MQRVRVLWVIKGLGPGGAETLLTSLAKVRNRERFHYDVAYVLPWKDHLVPALSAAGLNVYCLQGSHRNIGWVGRMRTLVREGNYDIVHFHSPFVTSLGRPALVALPDGKRPQLLTTEHNVWWSYAASTRALNAASAFLDERAIAVSDGVRDSIPEWRRRSYETVIHGVVMAEMAGGPAARTRIRREFGISEETVLVCTVANYRKQKAYPDLIDAAQRVRSLGLPVKFLAVGQGPLQDEIQELLDDAHMGEYFLLAGYRDDVSDLLAASDVFALSSHFEGFPVAIMEALAMGLPVVATKVGGIPQVVEHEIHGLLVEPGDVAGLAAAIVRLVNDPQMRSSMSEAAKAAGNVFDIEVAAKRLEEIYMEAVSTGPTRLRVLLKRGIRAAGRWIFDLVYRRLARPNSPDRRRQDPASDCRRIIPMNAHEAMLSRAVVHRMVANG